MLSQNQIRHKITAESLGILDFSGQDLSNKNFRGRKDLRYAIFAECNLENANFTGCDLTRADFTQANLKNAHLEHTILFEAAMYNTECYGTFMNYANATGAKFEYSNLDETNFTNAVCRRAIFRNVNLIYTDFTNANLENAEIKGPDVIGGQLKHFGGELMHFGMYAPTFDGANLTGTGIDPINPVDIKSNYINDELPCSNSETNIGLSSCNVENREDSPMTDISTSSERSFPTTLPFSLFIFQPEEKEDSPMDKVTEESSKFYKQ